MGGYEIENLKT